MLLRLVSRHSVLGHVWTLSTSVGNLVEGTVILRKSGTTFDGES
jgi:hypothetical protein